MATEMDERPAYRATVMKDVMANLKKLPAAERDASLRLMSPKTVEAIEASSRLGWIDADMVADLTQGMQRGMGGTNLERFWHDFTVESSTGNFFGQMHAAGLRMFGVQPAGFMRNYALAFRLTTRSMGNVETEIDNDARRGIVSFVDAPSRYLTEGFALSNRGSVRAMFTMMKMSAEAQHDLTSVTKGIVRYHLRW